MTPKEFWQKAESIFDSYGLSDDPDRCDFYVGEMDDLFKDWTANKEK